MAFVQVADFGMDAQRVQQSPSAKTQEHLLRQAQLRAAPI